MNSLLYRMGVERTAPVVLLAARDATYYEALGKVRGSDLGLARSTDTYIRNP